MIQINHLSFSYTGRAPYVLRDITLSIPAGSYISITGDNGTGKSTLMRIILGFLQPTEGAVVSQARRIGYVPQKTDFTNSAFPITVQEVMNSYRRLLRIHDPSSVERALRYTDMEAYGSRLMGTLSGGQHQKVLIARALMGQPDLLILDEPSSGVDVKSQKEIYAFLRHLNRTDHTTILSVEHNLSAAMANSTILYHLSEGCGHLCTPAQYAEEYLKGGAADA